MLMIAYIINTSHTSKIRMLYDAQKQCIAAHNCRTARVRRGRRTCVRQVTREKIDLPGDLA